MTLNMQVLGELIRSLQQEIGVVMSTFKDKGANRFGRPIALAGVVVYVAYALVYSPPVAKLATLQRRIAAAKATAQYADNYKALRDRLDAVESQLPGVKDRSGWLTNTALESLRSENIMADQIMPPDESEVSGYYQQKMIINATAKTSQVAAWVNRLETSKPMIHVHSLDIAKKDDPLGTNEIDCGISTLIPKPR